jgi:hypothetical protein
MKINPSPRPTLSRQARAELRKERKAVLKKLSQIDAVIEEIDAALEAMGVTPPDKLAPQTMKPVGHSNLPCPGAITQRTQSRPRVGPR